jgi:hypothetical protein
MRWQDCVRLAAQALSALALCLPAAAPAQPDPFRSSRPPAAQAARPAQPQTARPIRQSANGPANLAWLVDPRTGCRAQLNMRETPTIRMNWTGKCPNGVADGVGVLSLLLADYTESQCEVTLRAGHLQSALSCSGIRR